MVARKHEYLLPAWVRLRTTFYRYIEIYIDKYLYNLDIQISGDPDFYEI